MTFDVIGVLRVKEFEKQNGRSIINSLIQDFEADVSLKILDSGIFLKTFIHFITLWFSKAKPCCECCHIYPLFTSILFFSDGGISKFQVLSLILKCQENLANRSDYTP